MWDVAAPLGCAGWPHKAAKKMWAESQNLVGSRRGSTQRVGGLTRATCKPTCKPID